MKETETLSLRSDGALIPASMLLAGFATAIGQILVLRELLVLFYGNELSTGLVLACWFFWTAAGSWVSGRAASEGPSNRVMILAGLVMLALLLPGAILWIRAARVVWGIPPGELFSPLLMIATAFTACGGFCFCSGALFGLAWRGRAAAPGGGERRGIAVYLSESAGAAAGGLLFYFVFLPDISGFSTSLLVSIVLLSMVYLAASTQRRRIPGATGVAAVALLLLIANGGAWVFSEKIEGISRRWQWGADFRDSRDTPFHNLALLERSGQFSMFSNGLWVFSVPDAQTAELAAHLPLLQHKSPEVVLLIGGSGSGIVAEVLKHPQVKIVDCVEPDPEVIRLAREHLPAFAVQALEDPRVRLHYQDAGAFIRTGAQRYDVIVMSVGEPVNAEMNRFYTLEFFKRVKECLADGGVFSFSIASSPDMIGPRNALLLQSLNKTFSEAFEDVFFIMGEGSRFFGSNRENALTTDAGVLIGRLAARQLELRYVRDYLLTDLLSPMRLAYAAAIAAGTDKVGMNRDFEPVCYLYALVLWGAQIHPALGDGLLYLSGIDPILFWAVLAAVIAGVLSAFRLGRAGAGKAVLFNVAVAGGIMMGLEIVLLLGFQILEGFVYTQLALIITFFMAGLSLGAAGVSLLSSRAVRPLKWLFRAQILMALYLVAVLGVLHILKEGGPAGRPSLVVTVVFMVMALAAGVIGGAHFSLGALAYRGSGAGRPGAEGSVLYAADLIGAAAGGLLASLFFLPVYGIPTALLAGAATAAGASMMLCVPRFSE